MPIYNVAVSGTLYVSAELEVEATSEAEAETIALERASLLEKSQWEPGDTDVEDINLITAPELVEG